MPQWSLLMKYQDSTGCILNASIMEPNAYSVLSQVQYPNKNKVDLWFILKIQVKFFKDPFCYDLDHCAVHGLGLQWMKLLEMHLRKRVAFVLCADGRIFIFIDTLYFEVGSIHSLKLVAVVK